MSGMIGLYVIPAVITVVFVVLLVLAVRDAVQSGRQPARVSSEDLAALEAAILAGWPDDVERALYPTAGRGVQASPVRPPL